VQTSDGRKIYIEYFGIDREGNTAPYIDRDEYHQSINWKREIHRENKTTLIELTYQDLLEGTLTDKLNAALNKNSVEASWRSASDLVNAANAIGYTSRFVRLCLGFHSHARARRLDAATIGSMQPRDVRHAAFIRIFRPIAAAYEAELLRLGLPDYSEMIHGAADGLFDGTYEFPFDHVLVDEFQDISADRFRLLEAMKFANPAAHFFYVGDDWQSIYRFAGSDIGILQRMCRRLSKVRVHRLRAWTC
jgi:DNA helicase-4